MPWGSWDSGSSSTAFQISKRLWLIALPTHVSPSFLESYPATMYDTICSCQWKRWSGSCFPLQCEKCFLRSAGVEKWSAYLFFIFFPQKLLLMLWMADCISHTLWVWLWVRCDGHVHGPDLEKLLPHSECFIGTRSCWYFRAPTIRDLQKAAVLFGSLKGSFLLDLWVIGSLSWNCCRCF